MQSTLEWFRKIKYVENNKANTVKCYKLGDLDIKNNVKMTQKKPAMFSRITKKLHYFVKIVILKF